MNGVLTSELAVPLGEAQAVKVNIDTGSGNLTIDRLAGGEPLLASGTLQYVASQGLPTQSVSSDDGQATLTVRGGAARQPWFHLPWAAANGATEWQIHLNPTVATDITAHTGGGNVKLDLAGMVVTHLCADAGGGNLDVVLPEDAANLGVAARSGGGSVTVEIGGRTTGSSSIDASSGAGNVVVRVPGGLPARIRAKTGLGKVMVDPRFGKLNGNTYQSPDFEGAANRVEITVSSGAGNVSVNPK